MKTIGCHNYFVYIITNISKSVLYTGVTNSLPRRLYEHKKNALGDKDSFAGKYNAFYLLYWERFQYINLAIELEKQIKGWRREKKVRLISEFNPEWRFLNNEVE